MQKLIQDIDRLLRGQFTRREDLLAGRIQVPVDTLVKAGLLLGVIYGTCMGLFSVLRPENPTWMQLFASSVKVPFLFLLTLLVTFPSLYVFSALSNSRLRHVDTLRLMLAAIGVNLALLASLGPVTAFFTLSTDSYPFMVLLNVVFFAAAGFIGLGFLRKAVRDVFLPPAPDEEPPPPLPAEPVDASSGEQEIDVEPGGSDARPSRAPSTFDAPQSSAYVPYEARSRARPPDTDSGRRIFAVWTIIYAVVGAQMGWILRPFIGTPGQPFQLFRERDSNFFQAVLDTLERLLS